MIYSARTKDISRTPEYIFRQSFDITLDHFQNLKQTLNTFNMPETLLLNSSYLNNLVNHINGFQCLNLVFIFDVFFPFLILRALNGVVLFVVSLFILTFSELSEDSQFQK